jgi:hypothetical protein
MGHILGIGTLWPDFGLLSGAGTSNPLFVGANATAQYNQIFGTSSAGVPVENTGGSGTRDSHWRESILTNELMTGWAGPGTNLPLSRITVGSLADLGYTVNYAAADVYTPSSSQLTAARQASGSGASLLAPVGNSVSASSAAAFSDTFLPVRPHRSHALPVSHVHFIENDAADLATADSSISSRNRATDTFAGHDEQEDCSADRAWAELAEEWNPWPALAHA